MNDLGKLERGMLLTVKDAARLTNLSIPTFYTPQRKRDFGFDPEFKGQWLIPVDMLIERGLLTEDFQPTRNPRTLSTADSHATLEELRAENQRLQSEVDQLHGQVAVLKVLVDQKDQQLEMVNTLISKMGK
jgi:uncharacterized protein YlxW (UPF0749 family)